jgi:hypothetical protein
MSRSRQEGPQQRLDGLCLPVEHHAEGVASEQPCHAGPVAGRLGVPDGIGYLAMPAEPSGGSPVQGRQLELADARDGITLVIDDLHELDSPETAAQLALLLASLPPQARAILATRHDLPLRLHRLRLAGELAEIRAAELRLSERETRALTAHGWLSPRHRSLAWRPAVSRRRPCRPRGVPRQAGPARKAERPAGLAAPARPPVGASDPDDLPTREAATSSRCRLEPR